MSHRDVSVAMSQRKPTSTEALSVWLYPASADWTVVLA
jgi:hypothetical protein